VFVTQVMKTSDKIIIEELKRIILMQVEKPEALTIIGRIILTTKSRS